MAIDPGLVYEITDDEYDAFACGIESPAVTDTRCDELEAAGMSFEARALNLPSISLSRLANSQTVTRRVTNVSEEAGSTRHARRRRTIDDFTGSWRVGRFRGND
jgi:hypothetical protein